MPLTVKQVQNAKPGRHADGGGLYLFVKPTGARSWVLRVQHRGNRRDFGLGAVAIDKVDVADALVPLTRRKMLTLAEAREKARIGRELAKAGINPSVEWRSEELIVPAFREATTEYHAAVAKAWRNGKHGAQWLSSLEAYAFPVLGDMPVSDISADDISRVLLPIWLSKPETARRVRQRIGVVLDYSHGKGWREAEAPMRAVGKLLGGIKQPSKGNFEAMPYADLPAFVAGLRAGDASVGRLALHFLILTAARSGEVRGMTWAEVDIEAAEWRIPADRMKAGKVHIVPLVPEAVEILKEMRALPGRKPKEPVFPGLKGKPLSDATLAKVLRVNGGGNATVHGLRSTFRDWAADSGFADAWAEAALAHTVAGAEGATVAAYKRTTYYAQRRDKLMPGWSRFLLGSGAHVVQLTERRA